jgi:peptidoglycan/LPS O-acetylase OafA/YrhL
MEQRTEDASVKGHTGAGPGAPGQAVVRIPAIEGLRAWLAWTVVAYHLLNATNIDAFYGFAQRADIFGEGAVHVFMAISGFVIAGLIIERRETWLNYITRRAFRIFPAYWVALGIGAVAMFLKQDAVAYMTWADDAFYQADIADHNANVDAVVSSPLTQILLHLGLMQGAAPPLLAPYAAQSILGPAWTLSVEWQFYLVAPVLVWMMRRQAWALGLILVAAAGLIVLRKGFFSDYISYASLLPWLFLFVIGILSRLALPHIRVAPSFVWPAVLALLALGLALGMMAAIPFWLAFCLAMAKPPPQTARLAGVLDRWFGLAFESRLVIWLGSRSYATYILHSPIIAIVSWAVLRFYPFTRIEALGLISIIVIPATLLASELMHRFIEAPLIAAGAWIVSRRRKRIASPRSAIAPF